MTPTDVLTADEREDLVNLLWQRLAEVEPKMFAELWRRAHKVPARPAA